MLNGYRLHIPHRAAVGTRADHRKAFSRSETSHVELKVSTPLTSAIHSPRLPEHVWPKYVRSIRSLDKLELVIAEVQRTRGRVRVIDLALGVHSGFRTPWHNSRVPRAAGDSRHQYGDAADVVMDANGDGRITARDGMLVANAVERVEYEHPDLAGGLGLYTGRQFRTPYVHIDTRGKRARWDVGNESAPSLPEIGPEIGFMPPTSAIEVAAPAAPVQVPARPARPRPTE